MPQIRHVIDLCRIDGGNDVVVSKACVGGKAVVLNLQDENSPLHIKVKGRPNTGRNGDRHKSQPGAQHVPPDDQGLRDGKRFVVLMPAQSAEPREAESHVTLVVNFLDEVRRRVAAQGK